MATNASKQDIFAKRINNISSEISSITRNAYNSIHRFERLNNNVNGLHTRISRVRQANYLAFNHLESDQAAILEMWNKFASDISTVIHQKNELIQLKTSNIHRNLTQLQRHAHKNLRDVQRIESSLIELRANTSELQNYTSTSLNPLETRYQKIDKILQMAEKTVALVSQGSFHWKEGETPIVAIKAKDLIKEMEGVLTLTNHSFIFENEREIILKKRFFIVTEKKTVREVAVQKPIGMVTRITKGRVGLLKGSGLFVEFTPDSRLSEMKFDTKGQEADWVVQIYHDVVSGKVDEEIINTSPPSMHNKGGFQLVACPICTAPYTEEIYRGQTSVNCNYCGAVIKLQPLGQQDRQDQRNVNTILTQK